MIPEDVLKLMQNYEKGLKSLASGAYVAVGLPKESASRAIYEGGESVIEIGATHEFGTRQTPQRSFLRVPFSIKQGEIVKIQDSQHKAIFEKGKSISDALSVIGIKASNISRGAFTSRGYGSWSDISSFTKETKGSSQILIDTGTLRNSITHEVRDAS
jgi:hypothetical protein